MCVCVCVCARVRVRVRVRVCVCVYSRVGVNLRLLVYRYGMKNAGTKEKWEKMFQRYRDATLAQEKDKLLYGLASVEDVSLLNRCDPKQHTMHNKHTHQYTYTHSLPTTR